MRFARANNIDTPDLARSTPRIAGRILATLAHHVMYVIMQSGDR